MGVEANPVFVSVERALDAIALHPATLSDAEVRGALADAERLAARLRGWQARLIDEADRRELARREGCASATAWLSANLGISPGEATRRQAEASAVSTAPEAARALERGDITPEHVRTITATAAQEPGIDVDELLDHARTLDAGRFTRRAGQLRRAHQADGGLSEYEGQRKARCCSVRVRPEDGMVVLHAELDPLTGAKIRATLFSEADRLWRAEHADADEAVPAEARTNPQRLADALANVFGRPTTEGLAPETAEVLVTIDLDDLVGAADGPAEVVGVGPIPAATARRLACEAGIIPAVLGGTSELLDLGRSRRLASRAQRRALRRQHPTCSAPGCDVPFDWCQMHHLHPWNDGGRTDLANLLPLCTAHHHLAHEGGWTLCRRRDGTIAFDRPDPLGRPSARRDLGMREADGSSSRDASAAGAAPGRPSRRRRAG